MGNFTIRIPEIIFSNGRIIISKIDVSVGNFEEKNGNLNNNDILGVVPFFGDNKNTNFNKRVKYEDMASSVNRNINPCQNFYDFVCDGWINSHHIPEYDFTYDRLADIQYMIYKQLDSIIKESVNSNNGISQMMSTYYSKCLDPTEKNRYGTSYVIDKLQELKNKNFKFLTDFMIYIHPKSTFFSISVVPDPYDSTINRIFIEPIEPGLHYKYFLDPEYQHILFEYKVYLTKILELLVEGDRTRSIFKEGPNEINRRVESFIMFQNELAILANMSAKDSHTDDQSKLITAVSLHQLQTTLPSANWEKFFQNTLPQKVLKKINLSNMTIYLVNQESLKTVDRLLHKIDKQTMNDLLEWMIILNYYFTLDERFENLDVEFNRIYTGITKKRPKSIECLQATIGIFSDYIDLQYIQKYFNMNKKVEVEKMVKNILSSYAEMLSNSDWMDGETKRNALKKINKMIINVGYSDTIFNTTKLEEDFSSLYFNNNDMLPDIYDKIYKWKSLLGFERLLEVNNRNSKSLPSFVSNAYYLPYENTIGILAGALQNGFYDQMHSIPLNYGGVGTIIGHEITHAFDDSGSQYDEVGNFKNWWANSTKEKFMKKKDCFVNMYNDVYVTEVDEYLDGYTTQGENIADDGGIRVAFKAMKKALEAEDYQNRQKVEGLEEFNDDQLFFMNYAFNWCGKDTLESIKYQIREEEHTIPKYRVNVLLSNNEDFRKAFNCHRPDHMVSDEICRIF
uniref:Neprilysin n=1 Tax=Strongyloides papillosus TaxID=174720 RepID=A0A0N5BMF2_STREA